MRSFMTKSWWTLVTNPKVETLVQFNTMCRTSLGIYDRPWQNMDSRFRSNEKALPLWMEPTQSIIFWMPFVSIRNNPTRKKTISHFYLYLCCLSANRRTKKRIGVPARSQQQPRFFFGRIAVGLYSLLCHPALRNCLAPLEKKRSSWISFFFSSATTF